MQLRLHPENPPPSSCNSRATIQNSRAPSTVRSPADRGGTTGSAAPSAAPIRTRLRWFRDCRAKKELVRHPAMALPTSLLCKILERPKVAPRLTHRAPHSFQPLRFPRLKPSAHAQRSEVPPWRAPTSLNFFWMVSFVNSSLVLLAYECRIL